MPQSAVSPEASALPTCSRSTPSRINSRGPVAGVKGRGLQLRVIASTGALIGVGPAAVGTHIRPANATSDSRHDPGNLCRRLATRWRGSQPVRAMADPESSVARKMHVKQRGYNKVLERRRSRPEQLVEIVDVSGRGLAQASHAAGAISPTKDGFERDFG